MLKLKLQWFGHLMWKADWLEKTLMLGKIESKRRKGLQRMRCLDSITNSMDTSLSKLWEMVKDREALHSTFHRVAKNWTQLSKWTTTSHFTDEIKVEFLSSLSNFNYWYISSIVALQTEWSPQSRPTLCDPMDYSLPGSSVHRIFQARILEWVTISFSRG